MVEPTLKRLRAVSGEVSIPKRSGIVTRRQAKALDEGPSEDDDLETLTDGMDRGSDFEGEFRARRIRVRGNFAHKSL